MNLTFHADPSHGWLEIPLTLMRELNIRPSKFSYYDSENAYLEEDCDAALALNALGAMGINLHIDDQHTNGDSFIRSLTRFKGKQ
jgi:hypothetical protein